MSIPTINNGDELRKIRTQILNPVINKVNEVDGIKAIAEGNTAVLGQRFQDVVASNFGARCAVDYRLYPFTNATEESGTYKAKLTVALDPDEYAVRAVIRHQDHSGNGTMIPATGLWFQRSTNLLTVDTGNQPSGQIMVEFWKVLP